MFVLHHVIEIVSDGQTQLIVVKRWHKRNRRWDYDIVPMDWFVYRLSQEKRLKMQADGGEV